MPLDTTGAAAPAPAPQSDNAGSDYVPDSILDMLGGPVDEEPSGRDEGGRFKPRDAAKPEDDAAKPVEAEAKDEADDTEDEIELPPEKEGDQPKRLKLSEVLARATRAEKLEAEVTELKNKPIVAPEQWDQGIAQAIQTAQHLASRMEQWQRVNMPVRPDPRQFNTIEDLRAAEDWYAHQVQQWQGVEAERQQIVDNQQKQERALAAARMQRNIAQIHEFWPEIKTKETAQKVQDDLVKGFGKFGMTADLINSVDHPAFFALAKYALKGLQTEAVKEQAAKVVQQRPKLIKGQARQATSTNPRQQLFDRLAKSGSDDVAAALGATFFE